jgi:hypothetical protein
MRLLGNGGGAGKVLVADEQRLGNLLGITGITHAQLATNQVVQSQTLGSTG